MATEKNEGKKPLKLSRPGKLELKKTVEGGQVRQSFSHGRSKTVTVEVKRSRTYERGAGGRLQKVSEKTAAEEALAEAATGPKAKPATPEPETAPASHLTEAERASRSRAAHGLARQVEEEARRRDEAERLAAAARKRPAPEREREEELQAASAEAAGEAPAEVAAPTDGEDQPAAPEIPDVAGVGLTFVSRAKEEPARVEDEDDEETKRRKGKVEAKKSTPSRRGESRRRSGKLTIGQALGDGEERVRSLASVRRARQREKVKAMTKSHEPPTRVVRDVTVPEVITVQELSNRMAERAADVIKSLMKMGVMATITQTIDADTAELIVEEFGHKVRRVSEADVELGIGGEPDKDGQMHPRAPVVTVMGHVDHGKTSLLDALRETDVVAHEAGGITQHIGAYQVRVPSGQAITFIDTPGHAAFSAMRARGATVTDIVVLVVAADDGIKDQTVEAIKHAKAAEVPIIVAVNKIDKEGADPTRCRQELLNHDVVVEEYGGDVLAVDVSATKRTNLDKLEEAILLQADVLELKANPDREAEGVVIESKLERGRGPVATVLIQRGTLKQGDIFISGTEWGRVRALIGDHGNHIKSAGPSVPVEVMGLNGQPDAGDDFVVVDNESRAREITEYRQRQKRDVQAAGLGRGTLEQQFARISEGEATEVPVIIKADVQGSAEAIKASLEQIATDEVKPRVLYAGVGGISESDVNLAVSSNAMVIAFNVRPNPQAREAARAGNVEIRTYSIIYEVIDDMKAVLSGLLSPTITENLIGTANVLEVFNITKVGRVAGCKVAEGVIRRDTRVRLLRDDIVVHEGKLASLKRFKDEVREVKADTECGIALENYQDIQPGDVIECYEVIETARQL